MISHHVSAAAAVAWLMLLVLPTSIADPQHPVKEIKKFTVNSTSGLMATLEAVQKYIANGSGGYLRLDIARGRYHLTSTDLATFVNVSHVSIVGKGEATIDGGGKAGFVFREVSFLSLANLSLTNCSSVQNSTSTNATRPGNLSYFKFSVALYLEACSNVDMESAFIGPSEAVGVAMFNVRGTNTFIDTHFSENTPPLSDAGPTGGGGVILEFSFCRPGDLECNNSSPAEVSNSSFSFTRCGFTSNVAPSGDLRSPSIYPHGVDHVGFGRGGGLAVYFRGRAIGNSVTLTDCEIGGNTAPTGAGGGLYLEFGDESQNNNFTYSGEGDGSLIDENGPLCETRNFNQAKTTVGGGAMVTFVYYQNDRDLWPDYRANVSGNHVVFRGTYFTSNMACWGAGAAFVSSRAEVWTRQTNTVLFENCSFIMNLAGESAALGVSVLQPDTTSEGQLIAPVIRNCVFSRNTANTRIGNNTPDLAGYQFGYGAVYFEGVPALLFGVNRFTNNNGTGLVVSGTEIEVREETALIFESNSGRRGGALVVIGGGSLVVHRGSHLTFHHNQALELGGAVYVEGPFGQRGSFHQEKCFVRYYQPTVLPTKWNATFTFSDNSLAGESNKSNAVYITSLRPCVWPLSGDIERDVQRTLCWPGWTYDGVNASDLESCSDFVRTAPASFNNSYSYLYNLSVYSGHSTPLPIQMNNDYGTLVSDVVFKVTSGDTTRAKVSNTSVYTSDNEISVYGTAGNTSFYLDTLDPRVLSTALQVSILPCPLGYTPEYVDDSGNSGMNNMIQKCMCAYSLYFECNKTEMSAHILPGYCVGYSRQYNEFNHTAEMVVVSCPATVREKPVPLPRCSDDTCDLEAEFCASIGRQGRYCSRCSHGYTVDVNDIRNCVRCREEEYRYGWFIYLLTDILPITLFFLVVALFRVSATSAPMYAFVFFAQITTVRYFHNQYPWIYGLSQEPSYLPPLQLSLYSIWNLDFFIFKNVTCLSSNITTLESLLLKYLLAFYPMILILLSYLCIELYGRNYRVIVWLWSPFRSCLIKYRRSWQPRTSIIDSFATFLMISFTKITFITISLLTPAQEYRVSHETRSGVPGGYVFYLDPQYNYFEGSHLPTGILALAVGGVFVLAPPVFLLLYPTKVFQRCLNRCPRCSWQAVHTFADAFQGCFKNSTNNNRDCRYFSGLYLVLRIVILVVYAVEPQPFVQLLLQQILCILAVLVFALFKPYKEPFYNKVDLTVFSLLSLMNILSFANYTESCVNNRELNHSLFAINYTIGFLPLVYISAYVVYLFLKWQGVISLEKENAMIGKNDGSVASEFSSTSDIPDRLLHPENYTSTTGASGGTLSSDVTGGEEGEGGRGKKGGNSSHSHRPLVRVTEGSYFLKKARSMKNYGSM